MSDEYRQKKIDDGAVAFRWLGIICGIVLAIGALLSCGGEPDGCKVYERMDGSKYLRCKVNPFK